jgi:hypothetical protein
LGRFVAHCRNEWGRQMMEYDHTGDEELGSPMKVRELMARLKNVDPDFVIVIGQDSLLIVNPRPGFCQPMEIGEDLFSCLTEQDQQFLHELHIQ